MDAAGDEAALEGELEAHLEENRASLQAVDEALAADADNPELITVTIHYPYPLQYCSPLAQKFSSLNYHNERRSTIQ